MSKLTSFILVLLITTTSMAQSGIVRQRNHINNSATTTQNTGQNRAEDVTQTANESTALTIPSGTSVNVVLENALSSKLNQVGDEVVGVLQRSILVNGQVALKKGTEVKGQITEVNSARRMQRQASMTIVFDRFILPTGEELKIETNITAIDDFDNERKLKANPEGQVKGGRSGGKTVQNVAIGGALSSIALTPITLGTVAAGGGLGSVAISTGTVLGGGALAGVLLTKGNEIKLNSGTIFRLELAQAITLPTE